MGVGLDHAVGGVQLSDVVVVSVQVGRQRRGVGRRRHVTQVRRLVVLPSLQHKSISLRITENRR